MFKRYLLSTIALTLTALSIIVFIVARGSGQVASPTVTQASVVPARSAVTNQNDSAGQATNAQIESGDSALPQALADVEEGQVYTFTVDPSQTTVEYAVDEVLFGNAVITRGTTSDVAGEFTLSVQNGEPVVSLSELQVDLRTLTSDNNFRDQILHSQWLESDKYPMATFVAKEVQGLPGDAAQGESYTFNVTGDMTIRDITKSVTFQVTVTVDGATLSGEGTTQIYMRDFGFEPPEILGRFTVSDPATITIRGVANLAEA